MLEGKVDRVRWVKPYPSAHNHVAIGDVVKETDTYLILLCKTYHFGSRFGGRKVTLKTGKYLGGILEGEKATRIIPWSRIEVVNELPADTDWDVQAVADESGQCCLVNRRRTVVTRGPDPYES